MTTTPEREALTAWIETSKQAPLTGRVHELKTDPEVFDAVASGAKTHEIRFNDRGFQVGDTLRLRRTANTGKGMIAGAPLFYTGEECTRVVSHVLAGYGLQDGWVILSFAATPPAAPAPSAEHVEALLELAKHWMQPHRHRLFVEEARAAIALMPQPARALTDEQIDRHTLTAGGCPPGSKVMLVSAIRRLRARALTLAAPAPAPAAASDEREALMLEVGRQMIELTTTVQGQDEWLCIPELWKRCLQERDEALAALAARAPQAAAEFETRADGKTVRADRWQVGIRRIVALLWGNRHEFEIDEVVETVRKLVPQPHDDDESLVRAVLDAAPQPTAQAAAASVWRKAVQEAYGWLWHVNNEPMAPAPLWSPEKAAYEARKNLRELLTMDERGEAINAVRGMLENMAAANSAPAGEGEKR